MSGNGSGGYGTDDDTKALLQSRDQARQRDMDKLVAGSVDAIKSYGFDSVKCDSGFAVCRNMSLWAQLLNESGRPVMIENCQ